MPERIQLSRRAGWRLPQTGRSVARPSRWGNPFRPGTRYRWAVDDHPAPYPRPTSSPAALPGERNVLCESVEQAVEWHKLWITTMVPSLADDARLILRGWDLGCWCPTGSPCHADTLLAIANAPVGVSSSTEGVESRG